MKIRRILLVWLSVLCLAGVAPAAEVYDARIAEKEILTPLPGPAPRINGPKIHGARPGKQFLYRIPCQGERPMRFEVEGLPAGLRLDASSGILTGTVPAERGAYAMTFKASNAHGSESRPFTLVAGDQLALTPPVGWNSWGGHMLFISDEVMRKAADVIVDRGLADVGFQYVSIDDCWMRISPENFAARTDAKKAQHEGFDYDGLIGEVRDAAGRILPNLHFPDMKAMTDYIHARGLKAGLYSSPGPYTCQNFAGSQGYEKEDAEQYARWGFDFLKYDQCSATAILRDLRKNNPAYEVSAFWKPMAEHLRKQDRDIVYNLCQYGKDDPWTWAPGLGIQSWRIGRDLNHNVTGYFDLALRVVTELRAHSRPGHWNDPDYMYIHKIRNHKKMVEPTVEIPLDTNQRYQYATLWSVICAPFFFSCDIHEIDEFTVRLLGNADVVNINQDERGDVASVKRNEKNEVIMAKQMADGSSVFAVFNRSPDAEAVVRMDWSALGAGRPRSLYDVWRQKDLGAPDDAWSVRLSPNGVALFILRD